MSMLLDQAISAAYGLGAKMNLYEEIITAYPELTWIDFSSEGVIRLQNDSDGTGDYISKWDYSQPIPASLKAYDRT